ncbi:MAG TPA: SPFH domain-containing protein [Herpetosiphonaceae bacterium]|nr:SPFH domain-containing protein [Herpetosiphonaceae bacterium]
MQQYIVIGAFALGFLILLIVVFFALVTRYYVKAPADRAYVRTGGSKPKVVVNGGSWVIPAFHELTWVDLRTMDIDIERTEGNALLTIDPQYADIRAIFYIKVNPITEDIERAARTIGGKEVNNDSVKRLVESKLEGALRDVAATFTLMSLHQEREKFVERVQNLVRSDLAENGLVLEAVSITALKSARQGSFGTDDVFGAQVARANAEVIQKAVKQRNEIDQQTQTEIAQRNATAEQERNDIERRKQLEITRRNVSSSQEQNDIERSSELEIATRNATVEQEKLNLERNLAQARATQQREILIREAEERSAAERVAYTQQQSAELGRVEKERAIAEAEKLKEQAVQLAEQRKQQAIQLAEQEREREVQRNIVLKEQAVQVAEREKQVALAQEQAKIESAEKDRLAIAAEREAAEQQVFTVQERAAAEREAQIQIINAERDAKRELINRRNAVEIDAFKQIKQAEAEAEALNKKATAEATAAIKMAEANRTEAQASADAEKMRADATRATVAAAGLAEAEVIKARAEAATMEAEAIQKRGLAEAEAIKARGLAEAEGQLAMAEALAANEGVAQRLELERIRLSAQIEIGVAQAKAMGEAMAAMDFKLYGTPDTAQQLLRMVGMSDGVASLLNGAPAPLKEIGGRLLDRVLPNGNGHGNGQGAPATPPVSIEAAQPLIAEGSRLVAALVPAEELGQLTVQAALDRALAAAGDAERPTLLKLQGIVLLLPNVAAQPALSMLGAAVTPPATA